MAKTIDTWFNLEKNTFDNFSDYLVRRTEDAILRSIAEQMRVELKKKGEAHVIVPWGEFSAAVTTAGEGTNITPVYEPSKTFLKMLNSDDLEALRERQQTEFDENFLNLIRDYCAYGCFYPNENKNCAAKEKGMRLADDEIIYFLNEYAVVLATIAREMEREGKMYSLEVLNAFHHGRYDFYYNEDGISVKFTPDKTFKQYLKMDVENANQMDAIGTVRDTNPLRDIDFSMEDKSTITRTDKKDAELAA